MRARLTWLEYIPKMKDYKLPKIVLVGQPSRAETKRKSSPGGWEDTARKDLSEIETFRGGVKREVLDRLGRLKRV